MMLVSIIISAMLTAIPAGQAFLRPLQQRDSVLVADQFKFGFRLDDTKDLQGIQLADSTLVFDADMEVVSGWQLDTVSTAKELKKGQVKLECYLTIAPFDEGEFELPDLEVVRHFTDGSTDTLCFAAPAPLEVSVMPIDTTNYVIPPIKGQITYPITFKELLPYIGWTFAGVWAIAMIVGLIVWLTRKKKKEEEKKDPPHIIALRELDKYRSDKYWAPAKQKAFYSGITGVVKDYIDRRFEIDAPEMTTAELFDSLKERSEITPDLYNEMKELFERADFVKFAKYVADDEQNAKALPLCVRFVTTTYQAEIEEEAKEKDVL